MFSVSLEHRFSFYMYYNRNKSKMKAKSKTGIMVQIKGLQYVYPDLRSCQF